MKPLKRVWRRFVGALSRRRGENELADELAFHIEMQVEDNRRAGMAPDEAVRAARLKFGGMEAVKESYRDQRGMPRVEALVADLRYALRGLRRNPGFTITAVAALALGIGATTAIFSVVNTQLLKPLPFPDPDRLVVLTATGSNQPGSYEAVSPAMFAHWRKQSSVIEYVSAFNNDDSVMNYTGGDVLEQWGSERVSADFFRCIGATILRGRTFTKEEDLPNGPLVALIGQALWARRFASDPAILGRTISLNGSPYTVIGIVEDDPALLEFGSFTGVYVASRLDPNSSDQGQYFFAAARLKLGVTLEQAKERLRASTAEFRARFPNALGEKEIFTVVPAHEFVIGDVRTLFLVLLCAVGLVLLIACANVANLLLARSAGRRREFGIRVAIGAARGRIVRQLLTESLLLSLAGGLFGLWLGYGGMRALLAVNTAGFSRLGERGAAVTIDWRAAAFVLAVSLLTAFLFGLFPALHSSRVDLNTVLKDSAGRTGTGWRQNRARGVLVVSEVSLAVILLVGSALLIRSFDALYKVDRGFETKNVVTMRVLLAGSKYATSAGVADMIRAGQERIRSLPGVAAVSATCCIPLQGQNTLNFNIVGQPLLDGPSAPSAGWSTVSPGFFETLKIPVKRGREFTERDGSKSLPVAIINETLAKQYWKDGDPLNDRIRMGRGVMKELSDEPARQIVGIVGDVRDTELRIAPRPVMYVPQSQLPDAYTARFVRDDFMAWMIRT